MAGYSGTPLPKKLGLADGLRVAFVGAPASFARELGPLPAGVTPARSLAGRTPFDVIVWFVKSRAELAQGFARTASRLDPAGGLWVAWPKRSSGVATDVTEDVVREIALAAGLVDNKVCAIDEVWSGLRCVVRRVDRPKVARPTVGSDVERELAAALKKDAKAAAAFAKMPPSHRKRYLEVIAEAKKPETRAKRIADVVKTLAG
jgi:hypothetical protein